LLTKWKICSHKIQMTLKKQEAYTISLLVLEVDNKLMIQTEIALENYLQYK